MALIDAKTLLWQVLPDLSGADDSYTELVLEKAGRDLCRQSGIWREEMATATLAQAAEEMTPDVPETYEAIISRILWVRMNDSSVNLSEDAWEFLPDGTLRFTSEWPAGTTVDMQAEYWPSESCVLFPDWLIARWGAAIAAGAVWMMKRQAGKPWSDPRGVEHALALYQWWTGKAKGIGLEGLGGQARTVTLAPFV